VLVLSGIDPNVLQYIGCSIGCSMLADVPDSTVGCHIVYCHCSCLYLCTFTLTSSLCCAFFFRRHARSVAFLILLCFDGISTSSCLRASIGCVRQSIIRNPLFGHLREVLIKLSESNQVDLPVLVLFVSCLFARSRVVYTQASCKTIHISTSNMADDLSLSSPVSCRKAVAMDKMYLLNDGADEFTPSGNESQQIVQNSSQKV
jgi:hypothetical protein